MKKNNISRFDRSIFIDSADIEEITKWNETGVIDGVTTNQYIFLKDGIRPRVIEKQIKKICKTMKDKPVSIELSDSSLPPEEMVREARKLDGLSDNIVVKVPIIPDTLKSLTVIHELIKLNIAVNVTLMMTFEQVILAILATRNSKKTAFVSIFWGRSIEDHASYRSRSDFMAQYPKVGIESEVNREPKNIIEAAVTFLHNGQYTNTKIIAGSIRTAAMVGEAFAAGANIVTMTPDKLLAMLFSQRTLETIKQFDNAWKELQKKKR